VRMRVQDIFKAETCNTFQQHKTHKQTQQRNNKKIKQRRIEPSAIKVADIIHVS